MYANNIRAQKYLNQKMTDINREINGNIIIVRYFNIWISIMDRTSIQKINNETQDLNNNVDQMNLTYITEQFSQQ